MKKVFLFMSVAFFVVRSFALAAEVRNLVSGQSGDQVYVQYDLVGQLGEKAADVAVTLEINKEVYPAAKLSLEGDFGKTVAVGLGKRFYWRFLHDFAAGFEGDVTWDVTTSSHPVQLKVSKAEVNSVVEKTDAASPLVNSLPFRNTLGMTFVIISEGTFLMGSSAGEKYAKNDENPQHLVTISRSFYMQDAEVTQEQWEALMGDNPSYFRSCGGDCPIEQVSWQDVHRFIQKLNKMENTDAYRLPTEAEWEYAAKSGTKQERWSGTTTENQLIEYIYCDNYQTSIHGGVKRQPLPVKSKKPNGFKLYDMNGNVAEWVEDWYGVYSAEPMTNPRGSASGVYRVYRGGSFTDKVEKCRTAFRSGLAPANRDSTIGFRLVKTR